MGRRYAVVLILACAICVIAPVSLLADYYDNFDDGEYGEDPNVWDIDDPCWTTEGPLDPLAVYFAVESGWFRLRADPIFIYTLLAGAFVDYGDADPNTSQTVWDDTTSHYMLAKVANVEWHTDPNLDGGVALLAMHGNFAQWFIYYLAYEFIDDKPWEGAHFHIRTLSGIDTHELVTTYVRGDVDPDHYPGSHVDPLYDPSDPNFWPDPNDPNTDPNTYDPNDPNWQDWRDPNWIFYDPNMLDPNNMWNTPGYMDEYNGFWMVMQFTSDGEADDPNGKWLKGACWNGDKFDWDGNWTLEGDLGAIDANLDWWPEWYRTVGISGIGSFCSPEEGYPADAVFDHIEMRTGVFTNTSRTLTVKLKNCCELNLDPNLPHPDGGEKRQYTHGTAVVLDAVVPCGNKTFKKWRIMGPNDTGDPNYQIVSDTNQVVYLTMDGDYEVKAVCKCGGGVEPFIGVVLLVLGLGVMVRRLT